MLNLETIDRILNRLSDSNPVFHSEADFQHNFAWALREELINKYPHTKIRLEKPLELAGKTVHLDILISTDIEIAIELKYKTRNPKELITIHDEVFNLKDQSAQDCGRYDFLKDISRLEEFVGMGTAHPTGKKIGFAIFLTNDHSYWTKPKKDKSNDQQFLLFQAREITGKKNWGALASDGTMKGRNYAIDLKGSYSIDWKTYSDSNLYLFKYIALKIG